MLPAGAMAALALLSFDPSDKRRKLSNHGVAFLHHSNTGAYPLRIALAHRMPELRQRGAEEQSGDVVVIGDQGVHSQV